MDGLQGACPVSDRWVLRVLGISNHVAQLASSCSFLCCDPQLAREVLDIAASHVKPGVTTDFIDEVVHNAIIERNAYPSPLNYRGFPKSVCTYATLRP